MLLVSLCMSCVEHQLVLMSPLRYVVHAIHSLRDLASCYVQANSITTVGIMANVPCVLSSSVREIYDGMW